MRARLTLALSLCASCASGAAFMKWEDAGKGLPLGEKGGVRELAVGGSPPLLFAIVDGGGLFKSTDMGNSWAAVEGDVACLKEPFAIAVSPDGKAVFAASATPKSGLWRSADGGKSWAKCGDAATGMASDDVEWITVYEKDPKLVLVGHRAGKAVSVSADGGDTWAAKAVGAETNAQLPFFVTDTRWLLASRKDGAMFTIDDSGQTWAKATGNVGIFPGPLPVIQTGDYLFSSVHHGTNKSTDGGKTWAYTMERHARVIGALGPLLVREDREGIYGRDARVMTVMLSSDFGNSWQDVTCALLDLIPEARRSLVVIENKVDPFAHVRFATAWAATPDGQLGFLGLGKAGLYRGRLMWTKGGPILGGERLSPPAILEGDTKTAGTIVVTAAAKFGNLKRVVADLSAIGGSDVELLDDGQHGDGPAGDRVYGASFHLAKGVTAGPKALGLIAEDDAGRFSSLVVQLKVASIAEKKTVWDGDKFAHGLGWAAPQTPLVYVKPQTDEAKSGKVAIEFHGDGAGWMGGGWNWHGWYPENSGTDITAFRNLSFWLKVLGDSPGGLSFKLNNSTNRKTTRDASVGEYCPDFADGQWHEIVIPLADIYGDKTEFDPRKAWELDFDSWEPKQRKFSVYIDDIGFDNRPVRAHSVWVRLPEERRAVALAKGAEVTARHGGRRLVGRRMARLGRDADSLQLADAPVADEFAGEGEVALGPPLRAMLEHAAVAGHGVADGPPLGDGEGERLLAEHVLARLCRRDADHRVPVVGGADRDRINVVAVEEFAEVVVGRAALVGALCHQVRVVAFGGRAGGVAARLLRVAHGHHLARVQKRLHVARPASPDPDAADVDAVAGGRAPLCPQRRGSHE